MQFDFNKNLMVDSLDKVPEDFRGLYVEHEGKHKLATDDPKVKGSVSAIIALNAALNAARSDVTGHKARGAVIDALVAEYGGTSESIQDSIRERINAVSKNTKDSKEAVERAVEQTKRELDASYKVQIEKIGKQLDARTKQLNKRLVDMDALAALAEAKALAPEVMLPHVAAQVRVEEREGELVPVVFAPDTGDIRFSAVTGKQMSIKELVAQLRGEDRYKPFFEATAKTGGGAPPRGPQPPRAPADREKGSVEKIAGGLAARGVGR